MKKFIILSFIVLFSLTATAFATDKAGALPDKRIAETFNNDFPLAKNLSWTEKGDVLIAHFVQNDKAQDAYYNRDGEFLGQGWYTEFKDVADIIKKKILLSQGAAVKNIYLFLPPVDFPVYYATIADNGKELIRRVDSYGEVSTVWKKRKNNFINQ
jgi:hypothetical protein